MAELIQFSCPSCETVLRLPIDQAGWQGPCPRCHQEIIAPDPSLGTGARIVDELAVPPVAESESPASDAIEPPEPEATDPPPPIEPPVRLEPEARAAVARTGPAIPAAPVPRSNPDRGPSLPSPARHGDARPAILVLSILLSSVVSLVVGYLMGLRSEWIIARTPFPEFPSIPPAEVGPVRTSPPPVLVAPAKSLKPDPVPAVAADIDGNIDKEPAKASAGAETALRAFLEAPDWSSRSAYVLSPKRVRPLMKSYAREHPDGSTPAENISVESSYTDPLSGNTLFIFKVVTDRAPAGFPVAVAESDDGWLVDWESFVEFRDDRFRLFAEGPADQTARFHLLVRKPTPEQAEGTENEHFTTLMVEPPLPDRQRLVYVRKGTDTYQRLAAAISGDMITAPVLELAKKTTPDGKSYLEITRIVASDWIPGSAD